MVRLFLSTLTLTGILGAAETLSMLLDAGDQNELVRAKAAQVRSDTFARDAVKGSYLPRLDLGASATFLDPTGTIDTEETYTAYLQAGVTLFDGFRRENLLDEKAATIRSSEAELEGYRKQHALAITQGYFELQNLQGDLKAQQRQREQLNEELQRQQRFLEARIATDEEVERIRAAVANADYRIAALEYDIARQKSQLFNLTGVEVSEPVPARFAPPAYGDSAEPDTLRALRHRSEALRASAEQRDASAYPTLALEDTYSYYDYRGESTAFPIDRVDKQNRLMLRFSMNLIDFSATADEREAVLAQKLALDYQIAYESRKQRSDLRLAVRAIEQAESLIRSAELSRKATNKTLDTVTRKYHARLVDYVVYLDALYEHTSATAQLGRARNALQSAYAQYYDTAGLDLKEFLQ